MSDQAEFALTTVLYGGEEVLTETLPTWATALEGREVPVVVVDNTNDDGPSSVVKRFVPFAQVTRRPSNPGFAASANETVRLSNARWVLLLNADVFLSSSAIAACIAWISQDTRDPMRECAAVGLVTHGREYCGVELNAIGYFSDRPADSPRPPLGPSGGGALISTALFEAAGGFDSDLFAWGEDGGLSLRLTAMGVRTEPLRLALEHVGGHSVASLAGQRFKATLLARNRIRVMRRDWTAPLRLLLGPAQLALIVINGARKLRVGTASAHFSGVAQGLTETVTVDRTARFGVRDFVRYRTGRRPSGMSD